MVEYRREMLFYVATSITGVGSPLIAFRFMKEETELRTGARTVVQRASIWARGREERLYRLVVNARLNLLELVLIQNKRI
jgi:hypothetical protein